MVVYVIHRSRIRHRGNGITRDTFGVQPLFQLLCMHMYEFPANPLESTPHNLLHAVRMLISSRCRPRCFCCALLLLCVFVACTSPMGDSRSTQDTGVIYGMTSACAAVVGSVGTYLAGVILDTTDSWSMVFQVGKGPFSRLGGGVRRRGARGRR